MQLQTIGRWSLINLLVFVPLAIVLAGSAGAMTTNQVLWRNTNGDVNLWMMSGGAISSSTDLGVIPANWTIQGVGDFNGDGTPDILWRNSNGDVVIWFMTASSIASTADLGVIPTSWTIQGTGDFNGDGTTDILWRNSNGDVNLWFMNAGAISSSADLGVIPTSWTIQGTGNFNSDAYSDIVWRISDGSVNIWLMNGSTILSSSDQGLIPASWTIQGTGDFNGDGITDILWRNSNGDVNIWFMNGGALSSSADLGVIPSSWTVQGAGNFAGVMTDIVWRNSNGDVNVWLMNGSTISSSADLGVIPTAWTVSSVGQAVTATATPTPVALAVSVMGHQLINGSGNVIQLRGVNLSGMEFTAIQGWDPSDPTGGQMGQALGPNWTALNSWKPNAVRIPLNEASWLGLTCTDINGFSRNTDPGANYRQTLANLVQAANNAGLYVILDLHWAAPGNVCPVQQGQMADADHSLNFWTSIANTYKNNPAVLFELFNEPFFDNDFEGNAWTYMTFGAGGSFTGIQESGNGDPLWWEDVQTNWNIASYQAIITTIRNTGATNVLLVGTMHYSQDFSDWLADMPTDPLNQMAATWHPYPNYGTTWGTPAYTQPNYAPQVFTEVQNILAAGIPVVVTETGDQNSAGTGIGTGCALPANYSLCAPFLTTMIQFVDQYGISMLGWTWDVWSYSSNVLIRDDDGTPTDGYGQVFKSWLVNHQ